MLWANALVCIGCYADKSAAVSDEVSGGRDICAFIGCSNGPSLESAVVYLYLACGGK